MIHYLIKNLRMIEEGRVLKYFRIGNFKRDFYNLILNNHLIRFFRAYQIYRFIKNKKIQVYKLKELDVGLRKVNNEKYNLIGDSNIYRIIEAYTKSKKDQKTQPEQYQIGGQWQKILMECHEGLIAAFKEKKINEIKKILANFGINKVSRGLSLSGGLPTNFVERIEWLNNFNLNHYYWKTLTSLGENPAEYVKEIGNLPGIEKSGKIILQPSFRMSYFASRIKNLLLPNKNPIIVEIGGGYGGIPYHLFNEYKCRISYLDFDIPEICVIATYFLMCSFPNKKFLLYGEKNLKNVNIEEYDILVMPNYAMKDLTDRCCDLVFNSHSLTEMDYFTVKEYISQINRIDRKYFLHANHEYGMEYVSLEGEVKKSVILNSAEVELPKIYFRRLYRIPEKIQNITLSFSRGNQMYFEYLYERIK